MCKLITMKKYVAKYRGQNKKFDARYHIWMPREVTHDVGFYSAYKVRFVYE